MEWNEQTIAVLRALWAEGHSTAEIGRRMGVSKNAVVGKAHRLNLTARPSPIRRDASGAPPRRLAPRRSVGPTLPPLATTSLPVVAPVRPAASAPTAGHDAPVARAAERPAPEPVVPVLRPVTSRPSRVSACCWPIGEPGTRSFRFCDAEATHGKPYCSEHAQLAYVKVRDRREEAAA